MLLVQIRIRGSGSTEVIWYVCVTDAPHDWPYNRLMQLVTRDRIAMIENDLIFATECQCF